MGSQVSWAYLCHNMYHSGYDCVLAISPSDCEPLVVRNDCVSLSPESRILPDIRGVTSKYMYCPGMEFIRVLLACPSFILTRLTL